MKRLIIIGTGTTARNVYDFVRFHHLFEVAGFAVNESFYSESRFLGLPVYRLEDFFTNSHSDEYVFFIAILWNNLNQDRRNVFETCRKNNLPLVNLIAPTAVVRGKTESDNVWIGDHVVIQSGVTIESDTFIRSNAVVCHDTTVKAHSFISAGAVVGSSCIVGEQSFIGLNATVLEGIRIGAKSIVGAGVCLKENLDQHSMVCLSSSNYIVKQYDPQTIGTKLTHKR